MHDIVQIYSYHLAMLYHGFIHFALQRSPKKDISSGLYEVCLTMMSLK